MGWGGVTISASPATVSIPTGIFESYSERFTFTVPHGVKVIKIYQFPNQSSYATYIGVIPNSVHKLYWKVKYGDNYDTYYLQCTSHKNKQWYEERNASHIYIEWSPEINKHAADWWEH